MARIKLNHQYRDSQGNVAVNTKATIYLAGTSTPVTLYSAESGGSTLAQPISADDDGYLTAWLDAGQDVELVVTDDTDFRLHDVNERPLIAAGELLRQAGLGGGSGTSATSLPFSQPGSATVSVSGAARMPVAGTVTEVALSCVTAPTGSALVVEFRHNGVAFSTQTIAAGSVTDAVAVVSQAFVAGDKMSVASTSVGSSTAATGVVAQMTYQAA